YAPGDPLRAYFGDRVEKMSVDERAWAEAKLGLDRPVLTQYSIWLQNALPGGFGTFDELFDAYCLYKLGYHRKPCGLLNIAGYYNGLIRFIAHGVAEGLISRDDRNRLLTAGQPGKLLELLEAAAV
ncbi:LOG family protein, partial [Victivallis vadensis]|uniref:LOG family protein n=1 Tax=Victivallis vadensis TaxID=172901 RepID=UPI00267172AE